METAQVETSQQVIPKSQIDLSSSDDSQGPKSNDQTVATVRWLLQFLAELEGEPFSHRRFQSATLLANLFAEAEEKYLLCQDEIDLECPDFNERMSRAIGKLTELFPDSSSEIEALAQPSEEPPTVAELQSLLLACQTLSELKALKQKSPSQRQRVNQAYKGLDVEQQLKIDGISATAVPHQVFKYTGPTIQRDGQKLAKGALVFIDPNANVRHCAGYVPVWLMRGLELGWQKAISVSREFLTLVEKATTVAVEVVEGEQGTLLDSLG